MTPTFLAGLVVAGRRCVVVGDDAEAASKSLRLLEAGARVSLIGKAPPPGLVLPREGLAFRAGTLTARDLRGAFLVIDCRKDPTAAAALFERANRPGGFLFCAIDQPSFCTVTNVAIVRRGALQIGISTDGAAPMFAAGLRRALDAQLGDDLAAFVDQLARLRAQTPPAMRRQVLGAALNDFALRVTYVLPAAAGVRDAPTAEPERGLPLVPPRSRAVHKPRGSR